jgi:hypothetical protein
MRYSSQFWTLGEETNINFPTCIEKGIFDVREDEVSERNQEQGA